MRAISSSALLLALLLQACAAPAPQVPLSPQSAGEIETACRDLNAVDLDRIPQAMPDWSRFDEFHREARREIAPPQADASATLLKLAIPGGHFQQPYGLSVWAARQPDGRWRVSHVRYLQLAPPPPPPGMPPLPAPPRTVVTTGILKAQTAELVEAALASDCLRSEPFLSPGTLPMKSGPDLQCPPDGGGSNALEIVQAGAVRRYLRECGRTWASGAIIIALENSGNLIPD